MRDTNWFACFLLFLMYEAGSTKTTAMAYPAVLSAGQYPMLVSGNLFFLTELLLGFVPYTALVVFMAIPLL